MWVTVAAIVAAEGLVSGWNIGRASYNPFYVDSARSMSMNWRALAFGAFDPGAHITLDKLSGFLLPQVLSTWIFGFHPWSTMLPQVLEGMVTVLAAYVIGARWRGIGAGLLAAAATATMPLLPSMFSRSSEDCLITMSVALAFWCWQSAIRTGRLLPLLGSSAWLAVGFQAKMLQAWFIVPALAIGYLLAAPNPLIQRIRRGVGAGLLTAVLSLSWLTAISLVPAAHRPYIDGTTNNDAYTMVFGYNGLNRVDPNLLAGVIGDSAGASSSQRLSISKRPSSPVPSSSPVTPLGPGTERQPVQAAVSQPSPSAVLGVFVPGVSEGLPPAPRRTAPSHRPLPSTDSPFGARHPSRALIADPSGRTDKLFMPLYATQVGWLYPLAAAGSVFAWWPLVGIARRRILRRRDRRAEAASPEVQSGSSRRTMAGRLEAIGRLDTATATGITLVLWLIIEGLFLTAVRIPHTSYLAAISVQIALLGAAGLVQAHRRWADSQHLRARLVLPVLVLAQTFWTVAVLRGSGVAPAFLTPTVAVLGVVTSALLGVGALRLPIHAKARVATRASRFTAGALIGGAVLAAILAPAVWTAFNVTTTDAAYTDAYGGPSQTGRYQGKPALGNGGQPFHVAEAFGLLPDPQLGAAQQSLAEYLASRTGRGPMMAIDTWRQAEPYIVEGGFNVMPMGGFTGQTPTPTLRQLQALIGDGELKYVLLHDLVAQHSSGGAYLAGYQYVPGMLDGSNTLRLREWITRTCVVVPPEDYEAPPLHLAKQTLYHCTPADDPVSAATRTVG